jgi:alkyldihydroxyacetonephosphate synthase
VTILARQAIGRAIAQWDTIKRAACQCIMANGGAISHHHGVGYDHRPWLAAEDGSLGLAALRALKAALDPHGIMNPGKLLPTELATELPTD